MPASERGWKGEASPRGGMLFNRTRHGVNTRFTLDNDTLKSAEARRLDGLTADLQNWFQAPGTITIKDKTQTITGPVALIDALIAQARSGLGLISVRHARAGGHPM